MSRPQSLLVLSVHSQWPKGPHIHNPVLLQLEEPLLTEVPLQVVQQVAHLKVPGQAAGSPVH